MKKIISILPQKNLISLVQAIEHGKSFNALVPQLTFMINIYSKLNVGSRVEAVELARKMKLIT
ncbi:hypothetical protein [Ruminiclostridium cellobioparum]|jgi:hypothetical protein|uniref:hypothetical protein n=1 Tax=Ruminiclostridium cellobioparum TaxID=29355 RepID=UPI0004838F86|nr:hypothetical protein [Ruminiclostridium cellobioparum]